MVERWSRCIESEQAPGRRGDPESTLAIHGYMRGYSADAEQLGREPPVAHPSRFIDARQPVIRRDEQPAAAIVRGGDRSFSAERHDVAKTRCARLEHFDATRIGSGEPDAARGVFRQCTGTADLLDAVPGRPAAEGIDTRDCGGAVMASGEPHGIVARHGDRTVAGPGTAVANRARGERRVLPVDADQRAAVDPTEAAVRVDRPHIHVPAVHARETATQ